jgi:hypothetical protein
MNLRVSTAIVFLLATSAIGWDCGGDGTKTDNGGTANQGGGGEVWEQVFGTWKCTAAGREDWSFDVNRLSQYGSKHEWVDHAAGTTQNAYVELTQLYLMKADDTSYRNFEYKTPNPDVLDHLEEWAQSEAPLAQYECYKQ